MVFRDGQEVIFIRGDYSASGIIEERNNWFYFVSGEGIRLPVDMSTDILFLIDPVLTKLEGQENPREVKKVYMKLFDKKKELFNEFCGYYDKFKKENSGIPVDRAWIEFRRHYTEDENGEWIKI